MNVHSIVNKGVRSVNPNTLVTIRISTGSVQNADMSRTPTFNQFQRQAQVQPLSYDDIRMADGLNIQGYRKRIWINGAVEGLNRGLGTGGDFIILPDGTTWKIAMVMETWPDWCSAIMTLQVGP